MHIYISTWIRVVGVTLWLPAAEISLTAVGFLLISLPEAGASPSMSGDMGGTSRDPPP